MTLPNELEGSPGPAAPTASGVGGHAHPLELGTMAAVVALDQVTKAVVRQVLPLGESRSVIPQFLDLEKLTASHRHGMLRLTLPLKDSVKPRRVQIETQAEDQKQLAGVR